MISIDPYWTVVAFTMLCSAGLLIYAYFTGERAASPRLHFGMRNSTSRILAVSRRNEKTWRLPGIRRNRRNGSFSGVRVAYVAEYASRYGAARNKIYG